MTRPDPFLPHDQNIEIAVVGCLLMEPELAVERVKTLEESFFNDIICLTVFRQVFRSVDEGETPDVATIGSRLQRELGEKSKPFIQLLGDAPDRGSPAAFDHYVATLREFANRRRLLDLARRAHELASDTSRPLDGAFVDFSNLVLSIAESPSNYQEWTIDRLLSPIDLGQSLLGDRFLERGGTLAVVAPSGVGKTVASIQMAACWSIGLPAFHIKPASPMRVLVVENEDSENDTKGPLQGVVRHFGFNDEQMAVLKKNLKIVRLVGQRGSVAAQTIRRLAREWQDDIVIVNPLMAFVPGRQGEETEVFIREHLQPIATALNAGIVAIHHTPKIGRQNGVGTGANEYERQYAATGRAEVTNAFRAIVNIMPVGNRVFKFTADKRGRKIGWTLDGKPTIERYFKHSSDPDNPELVSWRDATSDEAAQAANNSTYQDILKVLPKHHEKPISRARVRTDAKQRLSIGKDRADEWLKLVIEEGLAETVPFINANKRKETMFRRCEGVQEVAA